MYKILLKMTLSLGLHAYEKKFKSISRPKLIDKVLGFLLIIRVD